MGKHLPLVGDRFGQLIVIEQVDRTDKGARFLCRCDCGKDCIVYRKYIRSGETQSCGCLKAKRGAENLIDTTTHGLSKHPLMKVWDSMKERCLNPNCHAYKDYGGRGISISSEWMDFLTFYNDVHVDYRPGLELDRYPDNDGNYCKENFRWATPTQNKRNRRNSIFLEVDGVRKHIAEWAEQTGIPIASIRHRIRAEGKAGKDALYGRSGKYQQP